MSKKEAVKTLIEKARSDRETAISLMKLSHYDWALFIWHIVLEKVIKAAILAGNKEIMYIHNLKKLASITKIELTKEQKNQLEEISTFNIAARYDDIKLSFYKRATKTYASKWSKICEDLYQLFLRSL